MCGNGVTIGTEATVAQARTILPVLRRARTVSYVVVVGATVPPIVVWLIATIAPHRIAATIWASALCWPADLSVGSPSFFEKTGEFYQKNMAEHCFKVKRAVKRNS